jgi:single-strand selective monofunctional uracil DNA glycosylase
MNLNRITSALVQDLQPLRFGPPVTHVYNPLEYAQASYRQYLKRYGGRPKEVLLVGMNPGPWGMAQTGIPFGEVTIVRDWLGIQAPVGKPSAIHPKRPVQGFACPRSEVSGKRLWGWAKEKFKTPDRFFARFFVANYCPLVFYEEGGRNRTPDSLRAAEKKPLLSACDLALRRTVEWLKPRYVVGIGGFAEGRASEALSGLHVTVGRISHPSPANPRANRGWEPLIKKEFASLGIRF